MNSLLKSLPVLISGVLLFVIQGCTFDVAAGIESSDADRIRVVVEERNPQPEDTETLDSGTDDTGTTDTQTVETSTDDTETSDTGTETDTPTEDTESESDTGVADFTDGRCAGTDGSWNGHVCGHSICGEKQDCGGGPPSGGCDCGDLKIYDPSAGCIIDPICINTEHCASDAATVDYSSCGSYTHYGYAYNHTTNKCQSMFGCPENTPAGFHFFATMDDCALTCATCTSSAECEENQYCYFPRESQCGALFNGMCTPWAPNQTCALENEIVCTCDYRNAYNPCYASRMGTSVRSDGECDPFDRCRHSGGVWFDVVSECDCPEGDFFHWAEGCTHW